MGAGSGRRWVMVTLIAVALVGAVTMPLAVWFVRETLRASAGAKTPSVAAHQVLSYLEPGRDVDRAMPFLCPRASARLRDEIVEMRRKLGAHTSLPYRLRIEPMVESVDGDDARVEARVAVLIQHPAFDGVWFQSDTAGWILTTERTGFLSKGWRVCGIEAPDICAAYIDCDLPRQPGMARRAARAIPEGNQLAQIA